MLGSRIAGKTARIWRSIAAMWVSRDLQRHMRERKSAWDEMHREGYFGRYPWYEHWSPGETPPPVDVEAVKARIDEIYQYRKISSLTELRPDMRVLDIGCGYGRLEEWLCSVVGRVDGVDVGTRAVETARKRFEHVPNVAFHEGDGFTLEMFSDATFDLVFAYTVFQHIPRGAALNYLREARRVLKPGGRVVIQYLGARSEKEMRGDVGLEKREYGIKYTLEVVREAGSQAGLTLLEFEKEDRDETQFWYWAIYGRSVS